MSNAQAFYDAQHARIGGEPKVGSWTEVSQERINQFADATDDHQFIHVDVEKATNESPFGGTIAHGMLTLSLLVPLAAELGKGEPIPTGILMGINYGFDKVRFIAPVPSGGRIRLSAVTSNVVLKGTNVDFTQTMTVELEGSDKPAMIAEWITRTVFDS